MLAAGFEGGDDNYYSPPLRWVYHSPRPGHRCGCQPADEEGARGMPTLIQATGKRPHQNYRAYGTRGERRFPGVHSKHDLYEQLRGELGMPPGASRKDIARELRGRDWDPAPRAWVNSPAASGPA